METAAPPLRRHLDNAGIALPWYVGALVLAAFAGTFFGPPFALLPGVRSLPSPARVLGAIALAAFSLSLLYRRRGLTRLDVPAVAMLVWIVALVVAELVNVTAYGRVPEVLQRLVLLALMYFMVRHCDFRDTHIVLLLVLLMLGGIIGGIAGAWQSMTGYLPPGTIDHAWNRVGPFIRAGVGVTDENFYAASLAAATAVCVACIIAPAGVAYISRLRPLALVSLPCALVGIVFTFSRGGMANALLSSALVCWIALRRGWGRRSLILAMTTAAALAVTGVVGALLASERTPIQALIAARLDPENEESGSSTDSRGEQISFLLNRIEREPSRMLIGFGSAGFEVEFGQTLHNTILSPLSTAGILGFLSFLVIPVVALRRLRALLQPVHWSRLSPLAQLAALAASTSAVGWYLQSLTLPGAESTLSFLPLVAATVIGSTLETRDAGAARS